MSWFDKHHPIKNIAILKMSNLNELPKSWFFLFYDLLRQICTEVETSWAKVVVKLNLETRSTNNTVIYVGFIDSWVNLFKKIHCKKE